MKAIEARTLAIQSCKDEIETISNAIRQASRQGYTAISCMELQQGTQLWLGQNGYNLTVQTLESHTVYQIKWD